MEKARFIYCHNNPVLFCLSNIKFQLTLYLCVVVTRVMGTVVRIAILVFFCFSAQLAQVNSNSNIAKQNMRYVYCMTICAEKIKNVHIDIILTY
jgi:hypothetical protein